MIHFAQHKMACISASRARLQLLKNDVDNMEKTLSEVEGDDYEGVYDGFEYYDTRYPGGEVPHERAGSSHGNPERADGLVDDDKDDFMGMNEGDREGQNSEENSEQEDEEEAYSEEDEDLDEEDLARGFVRRRIAMRRLVNFSGMWLNIGKETRNAKLRSWKPKSEFVKKRLPRLQSLTPMVRAFLHDFEHCVKVDSSGSLVALYDAMRDKLHLEVRNIIYSDLLTEEQMLTCCGNNKYNPDFMGLDEKLDSDLKEGRRAFHAGTYDILTFGGWLLNPEYVGHGMAREVAEMFYSSNNFDVSESNFLSELLTMDRTQTGLKPYEYIRQIEVTIHTPDTSSKERAWQNTENEFAYLEGIHNQLKMLNLVTHKSGVSIKIRLWTSSHIDNSLECLRRFYNLMEAVRLPIYELIHKGVKIWVKHVQFETFDEEDIINEDPKNFFSMGKEQWEEEMGSHGLDWLPSANFISRENVEDNPDTVDLLRELLRQRWGLTEAVIPRTPQYRRCNWFPRPPRLGR
jgi:hypothetical protein